MQLSSLQKSECIESELLDEFGPYVGLGQAWRWLSYPSLDAARKSCVRGKAPVSFIRLPGRRGLFTLSSELAAWLKVTIPAKTF